MIAAADLGSRISLSGETVPPRRPDLARAQRDGGLSVDSARVVADCLRHLDTAAAVDPGQVGAAERLLVDQARVLTPRS